ncbi:HU family DNA-binding protein [Rhodobacter maris]|uniref:DNA-binding protein n=1 Tax=Rhodobacter maris TaxID=446682 RepID=A0A285RM46_9RHOB|nr:HU family DNA-binding protein [Rhodobacter maris]SOB93532.1 DNA-binding protein [Rhodobacter maris]
MEKSSKKRTGQPKQSAPRPAAGPEGGADGAVAARVQVKKNELVERVALKSGVKKAAARDLTDAVLAVLAEALEAGETLLAPPLGKLALARRTDRNGGTVLHLKLRRAATAEGASHAEETAKKDEKSGPPPLAKPEE